MNLSAPHTSVSPSSDLDVLRVLAGTTQPLNGRQIARMTGRSQSGVLLALRRLVAEGLVDAEAADPSVLYALNRDHVAADAVLALADLRNEIRRRITSTVQAWATPAVNVSLFGSAARGDGDTESDIDLLIFRPSEVSEDDTQWREQLDDLAQKVYRWTGNHAQLAELDEADLLRLIREDPPILSELKRDARDLMGTPVRTLLRGHDRPSTRDDAETTPEDH